VPATAHRNLELGVAREVHGRYDVGRAGAASDHRWALVMHGVEDLAGLVMPGIAAEDHLPLELSAQRVHVPVRRHVGLPTVVSSMVSA
jgi:hypothetical protein